MRYGLIVLVLGTVAACTSDADPGPTDPPSPPSTTAVPTTPTPTPTASPSPSVATTGPNVRPGEKPPVLPSAARTNTRLGAAAFANYWFASLDWGYATTDSTLAKTLFSAQCEDCQRFVNIFDKAKAVGNHFAGGRTRITKKQIITDDARHPGSTVVDALLSAGRLRVVSRKGKTVEDDPPVTDIRYRLWLQWAASRWTLIDYKRVEVK